MEKHNISLSLNEVNKILDSLSFMPYRDVYELMSEIKNQVENKLNTNQHIFPMPSKNDE